MSLGMQHKMGIMVTGYQNSFVCVPLGRHC